MQLPSGYINLFHSNNNISYVTVTLYTLATVHYMSYRNPNYRQSRCTDDPHPQSISCSRIFSNMYSPIRTTQNPNNLLRLLFPIIQTIHIYSLHFLKFFFSIISIQNVGNHDSTDFFDCELRFLLGKNSKVVS